MKNIGINSILINYIKDLTWIKKESAEGILIEILILNDIRSWAISPRLFYDLKHNYMGL